MSKFSFDTIKNFDSHISASIAGYEMLHQLIINISGFFYKGDNPVDLGCTSGRLIKELNERYGCNGIGFDITANNFIEGLDLRVADISLDDFDLPKTSLVLSVFTLQFLPVNKRLPLVKKVFDMLPKNGAFIVCEKEICQNGHIQEVFTFSNYDYKRSHFSPDEILSKENDLRRIMNCVCSEDNLKMFKAAGFKTIEPFFQSLNFKGYICKK